jgi:hypothetical protein
MAIYFAWDSGARPFQFDSINDPHQYVLCATGAPGKECNGQNLAAPD